MAPKQDGTAVVIGASIAGVLAARSLTRHFDRVILVDRDQLPPWSDTNRPAARGGVPQGRHTHGLLARGREIIEEMFPGATDELVARGAVTGDLLANGRWHFPDGLLAPDQSGLQGLGVSRPLLEGHLRSRLLAAPGVEIRERTSVLDLAFAPDEERVVGVLVAACDGGQPRLLSADLVVDASGRSARTSEWIARRGYAAPDEEVVRVDKHYATRTFRRQPDDDRVVIVVAEDPDSGRGGVMVANEGDRWAVSLTGAGNDRPPRELPAFMDYARSLGSPALVDALEGLEPLDEGLFYRFPANRRRRYERLRSFPEGLVVTGDALCSFDPVFGQGMTVATLEAHELGRALEAGTADLARRFYRAASKVIDTPWTIAVGTGPKALHAYLDRLLAAATYDPALAMAFLRVSNLVDTPAALLRLPVVMRVVRGSVRSVGGLRRGRHDLEQRLAQRVQKDLPVDAA